jgi:PPP family 3-phenylpropionic acid transporter
MSPDRAGALPRFIVLYALMYGAFGVASPFMPALLESRGLAPEQLGVVFAAGTAIRLLAGPLAGRVADYLQALRAVLALCIALAALVVLGLLPARGFWLLLLVSLAHAAALAPITTLADALALGAATPRDASRKGFEYGWVRGAGSAAFIIGTLASGQFVAAAGLASIAWSQAVLLAAAAGAALLLPQLARTPTAATIPESAAHEGVRALLRVTRFRRLIVVAALILGSHAMHDAFAVIRWSAAGISPGTASLLWSESVAAEVVVFFVIGPPLVKRLGPAGAAALAACAGIVRWTVMSQTTDIAALALVQPLHGFTFALFHLACMRIIAEVVPRSLAATAQAIYGTIGVGAATALLTLVSGMLYARAGPQAFLVMALLCAVALPATLGLRGGNGAGARTGT